MNLKVELEQEVVETLDEIAEKRDTTRSRVASEMIADWLERRSA